MGIGNDYKLPTNEARTQKSSLYINRYAIIVAAADAQHDIEKMIWEYIFSTKIERFYISHFSYL